MKGLLVKDIYVLIRQMRLFLLLVVVFAVMPGYNMAVFSIVYAAMMPYTALAYDERSKWDQLAAMMPYTTRDIVLSKYILGYLFTGGAAAVALIAGLIESRFIDRASEPMGVALSLCVGLIVMAVTLPPMFKFGVERGRMFFLVLIVVVAVGSAGLVSGIAQSPYAKSVLNLLGLVLPLAAIAVNVLSIPLSIRLYNSRNR